MVFFGLREGAFNGSLVPIVLPARRLLLQRLSIPIVHIQLSQIRLGHLATSASFPLRLFAMAPMCIESTHKIAPRAGPFATHCRRISLKTCPAMLLSRKRRRFRLIAVAASALLVGPVHRTICARCCSWPLLPAASPALSPTGIPQATSETGSPGSHRFGSYPRCTAAHTDRK